MLRKHWKLSGLIVVVLAGLTVSRGIGKELMADPTLAGRMRTVEGPGRVSQRCSFAATLCVYCSVMRSRYED